MKIRNVFQATILLGLFSTSAFGYTAVCQVDVFSPEGFSKTSVLHLGSSEADYTIDYKDGTQDARLLLRAGSTYEVNIKNREFSDKGTGFVYFSLKRQIKQTTNNEETLWSEKSDSSIRFKEKTTECEKVKGTDRLYWVMENIEYVRSPFSVWGESTMETREVQTSLLPTGYRLRLTCNWIKDYR